MSESFRKFLPWKGPEYDNPGNYFGLKLMVLGLSFYSEMCRNCPYGKDCGNELCRNWPSEPSDGSYDNVKAYKKFASIVAPGMSVGELWQHITFTNYVQIGLSRWNEIRRDCYPDAEKAFYETVMDPAYRPDRLIMWGAELRNYSPGEGWQWRVCDNGRGIHTGYYELGNSRIEVYIMPHPSYRRVSNVQWETISLQIRAWLKNPETSFQ